MWIFTRTGFYTVVENRKNKDTLLLRARVKKDLEAFLKRYVPPSEGKPLKITFHLTYDYPYRVIISKDVFAEAMASAVRDIDYAKYKEAVRKEQGADRASFYTMIWGRMIDLEKNKNRIKHYFNRQDTLFNADVTHSND